MASFHLVQTAANKKRSCAEKYQKKRLRKAASCHSASQLTKGFSFGKNFEVAREASFFLPAVDCAALGADAGTAVEVGGAVGGAVIGGAGADGGGGVGVGPEGFLGEVASEAKGDAAEDAGLAAAAAVAAG